MLWMMVRDGISSRRLRRHLMRWLDCILKHLSDMVLVSMQGEVIKCVNTYPCIRQITFHQLELTIGHLAITHSIYKPVDGILVPG